MSIHGTYKHYVDLTLAGEHVSYDVEIDYEYHPGIYDNDPCYSLDDHLSISKMALIVDDGGMSAVVPSDYHDGVINQLNPAFQQHLEKQWQEHLIDRAGEKAIELAESRLFLAVGF